MNHCTAGWAIHGAGTIPGRKLITGATTHDDNTQHDIYIIYHIWDMEKNDNPVAFLEDGGFEGLLVLSTDLVFWLVCWQLASCVAATN